MTTPNIGLTELSNSAGQYLNANETFAVIDALLQTRAISKSLTSAPVGPGDGDVYIMASAWAGITTLGGAACAAGDIALYRTGFGAFKAIRPKEGWKIEVAADDQEYRFDGTTWIAITGGGGVSLPVIRAITANESLGLSHINTFGVNSTTSNFTSTIPAQASVAWTADAELHFLPSNTGDITITAAASVTLNGVVGGSVTLSTQNGAASIKRKAADDWWIGGAIGTKAEQRTALGLGSTDSPTFTALTLSNGQIAFPATQVPSANANTLDDYEEGTWTPVLTFATPGDLSVAYSLQNGSYTKIGRRLIVDVLIQTSSFTHTTASGNLQITGVPFSASSSSYGDCNFNGITKTGYGSIALSQPFGGTTMNLIASGSGVARLSVVAADAPTGGTIILAGAIAPNT